MILLLISAICIWLICREIFGPTDELGGFSLAYVLILAVLAFACARPVYKTWRLEHYLSEKASVIAERENVSVKCNSLFDTIFAGKGLELLAGTAYFDTGEIFFEHGWCKNFSGYLDHPENPSDKELFSMHVFTHEVMHIRGERNERLTDCQAIQRNHHVAQLMGIKRRIARRNAREYYQTYYPKHPYFDKNCKPNGEYDEHLADPLWDS